MQNEPKYPTNFDRILSLDEVAAILGISKGTLWRWHQKDKTIAPPLKVKNRAIGYKQSTIEAFLEKLSGGANQ